MRLFNNPLLEVNTLKLMLLWGELVEAYYGVNGYGGDTVEIFSYRLQSYSPSAHCGHPNLTRRDELLVKAGNQLVALVEEFCATYECDAEIDGLSYARWCMDVNNGMTKFGHRVCVRIVRDRRAADDDDRDSK